MLENFLSAVKVENRGKIWGKFSNILNFSNISLKKSSEKNRKSRRKNIFIKFIFRFGARKMRCGMCLSTHRASFKKVWERFYVGEFFYPLSKSKTEGKSEGNSRIFWIFQIFRWKIIEKNRENPVGKNIFQNLFIGSVEIKWGAECDYLPIGRL